MKVCQTAKRGVKSFIEEAFPIMGTILDKAEEKKDEIKSVYISVGSDAGVVKGNKFSICVERKIAGDSGFPERNGSHSPWFRPRSWTRRISDRQCRNETGR